MLLTNEALSVDRRQHLMNNATCPVCKMEPESVLHLLWDCGRVRSIWMELLNGRTIPHFNSDVVYYCVLDSSKY